MKCVLFEPCFIMYCINDKSNKNTKIIIYLLKYFLQFCKENMEGKSFYAKGGKIFCKAHAAKY